MWLISDRRGLNILSLCTNNKGDVCVKQVRSEEDKRKEADFIAYKKLIRNLRRGKVEKINSEKACNNITKK